MWEGTLGRTFLVPNEHCPSEDTTMRILPFTLLALVPCIGAAAENVSSLRGRSDEVLDHLKKNGDEIPAGSLHCAVQRRR